MADNKVDEIGDEYHAPLLRADACANILFGIAGVLSIATLLLDKQWSAVYAWTHVLFVIAVVALFVANLAVRLYFFPRAQTARFRDFLTHAFGQPLSPKTSQGYYNNNARDEPARIAAQVLESCFFTKSILGHMALAERLRVIVYMVVLLAAVLNRATDLPFIVVVAQIVFSEQLLARWFRFEYYRREAEQIFDDVYRCLQSGSVKPVFSIEYFGRYEVVKATAGLPLSTKVFEEQRETLNAEWERLRGVLRL